MITIFKFIATLLITNSHFEIFYPDSIKFLSAGGSLGNSLFFFCTGYTLYYSSKTKFINWYGRRISRIYPAVFVSAMIFSLIYNSKFSFYELVYPTNAWFISAIMVFYLVYYLILKVGDKFFVPLFILLFLPYFAFYFTLVDLSKFSIEDEGYFKWIYYFQIVLLGGITAAKTPSYSIPTKFKIINVLLFFTSYTIFRILLAKNIVPMYLQFGMHLIEFAFIYSMYVLFKDKISQTILEFNIVGKIVTFISGLTLEVYLIQFIVINNNVIQEIIFPINLVAAFTLIIFAAYITNKAAKAFVWIFKNN